TIGSQATVNSLKINVTETPNAKNRVSNKLFSMQLKEDGVEIKIRNKKTKGMGLIINLRQQQ
ncbi:hypothetical protein ACFYKN_27900, partial [Klebsiella pneumoniae]